MRPMTIMTNLGALVIAVAGGTVIAGPLVNSLINGASIASRPIVDTGGALSFLILAPTLALLAPGALHRLGAVLAAGLFAYGMEQWLDLVVSGRTVEAVMGLSIAGLVLALGLAGLRMASQHRRSDIATLARRLCALTADVTETLRRRHAGTSDAVRIQGPMARTVSVERMVFDIITDALTEEDQDRYARRVARDLTAMRQMIDLDRNRDREGYSAIAATEYASRLLNELRTRSPEVASAMRNAAHLRTAS